jgi:hypothetical protein
MSSEEVEGDPSIWKKFFHYIYGLANTFHHSNRKFLASDVQPFMLEIPFGPSNFVSELGVAPGRGWGTAE